MRRVLLLLVVTAVFTSGCTSIRQSVAPPDPQTVLSSLPPELVKVWQARKALKDRWAKAARLAAEKSGDLEAMLLADSFDGMGLAYATNKGELFQVIPGDGKTTTRVLLVFPGEGPEFIQSRPDGLDYNKGGDVIILKGEIDENDLDVGVMVLLVTREAALPEDAEEWQDKSLRLGLLYRLAERLSEKIASASK